MRRILFFGLLASVSVPVLAAQFINVLAGGTSGVYYPLGMALSNIYADHVPDIQIVASADSGVKTWADLKGKRVSLMAAHAAAKDVKLEDAVKGMPVPLHPGAGKYYREAGVVK